MSVTDKLQASSTEFDDMDVSVPNVTLRTVHTSGLVVQLSVIVVAPQGQAVFPSAYKSGWAGSLSCSHPSTES